MLAGDGGGPIKLEISAKTRVCFALLTKVEEFGPSDRKTQKEKERMFLDFLLLRKTFRTVTQRSAGSFFESGFGFQFKLQLESSRWAAACLGESGVHRACAGSVSKSWSRSGPDFANKMAREIRERGLGFLHDGIRRSGSELI